MNPHTERRLREDGERNAHRSRLAAAPEGTSVVYTPYPGARGEDGVIVRATEAGVFVRYRAGADAKLTPYERLELLVR